MLLLKTGRFPPLWPSFQGHEHFFCKCIVLPDIVGAVTCESYRVFYVSLASVGALQKAQMQALVFIIRNSRAGSRRDDGSGAGTALRDDFAR